ncbi:Na+/H+ antiporter subunit E [Propionicicella superfundia]|uniref:Na+/H+ antiporter subunit E n=1 Tax=Propionicicella superfundia TaxID=348582 RepID=UPI00041E20A6|nr:Na+/H+ antiporter subunit E [Propionicicella superfundia]
MKMRTRLRFRIQWKVIAALCVVWLTLWREVTLLGILTGLLVGWLVTVAFPMPPTRFRGRIRSWGLCKLIVLQLRDLIIASFALAVQAFEPRLHITPAVVKLQLRSNSDLYQAQTAEMIAIIPGTLVVESDRFRRVLYLHVFNVSTPEEIESTRRSGLDVEKRVMEAFASTAELVAYRAKVADDEAGSARMQEGGGTP